MAKFLGKLLSFLRWPGISDITQWHEHPPTIFHNTPRMRRKLESGEWEYRAMTPDEETEYVKTEAW